MASKRTKNHKEIHEEAISNEEFLDILKRLVKIESEMKKWAKKNESEKKKDREEKDILVDEIAKLKIENINLQRNNLMTSRHLGKMVKYLP